MRPKNSSPRLLLVVSPAMVLLAIAVTWLVFFGTSTAETDSKKNIPEVDSSAKTSKALECGMRKLALEYARSIHSWRDPDDELFRHIHDALQLTNMCGQVPPESTTSTRNQTMDTINKKAREIQQAESKLLAECDQTEIFRCIYVTTKNPSDDDSGDGSFEHPIGCLHKALALSRSARKNSDTPNDYMPTRIILREGVHELHYKPLLLTGDIDSDLELVAYPGEDVWISGGMAVPSDLTWKRWNENDHVWVTNLKEALKGHADKLPSVFCLFTVGSSTAEHQRLIRARYPNGNPELDQWGYISPGRDLVSIPKDVVLEWHKADAGPIPTFDYILLDKNDSTMDGYNMYASGHGGVCASQWGPDADSYWCSNYSQGGWSEVDRECAMTGQLQIPVGMTLNTSAPAAQPLSRLSEDDLQGGIVFAWHSQTWAMHMFRISGVSNEMTDKSSSDVDSFYFEKGGGKQGGRNWCKCNQCTYAGAFCGQHKDPPDNSDTRLIGGNWFVENLLPELDQAGEYFYSPATGDLYVYPNITEDYSTAWQENLRFAVLDNIVEIRNASNVGITNIGFRDSAATYMSDWSAPSGGDWALHRGGAVFLESTKDVLIRGCLFRRLDGNAVFLSRWNRHTLIEKNTFEWLGENAIATWGDTAKYDATVGNQPWQTMIYKNVMRELGKMQSIGGMYDCVKTIWLQYSYIMLRFSPPSAC